MGELHPLPIPEGCWDMVSIDFIVELPKAHGFDTVMVVVDSARKCAHFIPTHTTITTLRTAWSFLNNVWKLHRLLINILSDWGPQFVAEFMKELYKLLGSRCLHQQHTTHGLMDKQSVSIKNWNSNGCSIKKFRKFIRIVHNKLLYLE
jgi:hypothetical protein